MGENDPIGKRLKEARGATPMRAAAKEIGISQPLLSFVERGLHPGPEALDKISRWVQEKEQKK